MLQTYKRFVYMVILGTAISALLHFIIPPTDVGSEHAFWKGALVSILITVFVWEGSLRIDGWLDQRLPWVTVPGKRVLVQFTISSIYCVFVIYGSILLYNYYLCKQSPEQQQKFFTAAIVIGLLVTILLLTIEIGMHFFRQWKKTLVEVEQYKSESAMARLENLKNQINPHFLFNNMSVLSSLVYKDQDKAVDFINQLSKVYRYLLDSGSSELTTLEDEMQFLQSYTYLLNIRYSPNIHFDIDVSDEALKTSIPPMSVQLLIENAIKHNEISSAAPLTISIRSEEDWLIVENNLQLRSTVEIGSGTGLKNICSRYRFFTDLEPEVSATETHFYVKIPLLKTP
ncbi:MAG: histidine kinase [Flavobacteriia bacterium]|nr:histidine kinase [Flavobacteriia bacterium]